MRLTALRGDAGSLVQRHNYNYSIGRKGYNAHRLRGKLLHKLAALERQQQENATAHDDANARRSESLFTATRQGLLGPLQRTQVGRRLSTSSRLTAGFPEPHASRAMLRRLPKFAKVQLDIFKLSKFM